MGKVEQIKTLLDDPFAGYDQLTEAERRVMKLASRGLKYREIAVMEEMGEELVAYYMRSGMLKIGVKKSDLPGMVIGQIQRIVG